MKRTWSEANAQEFGQLGIIESVRLRNFMCHDNLSFEFDPHMNFIVGRNGSGKSAVLTGIILALGGKSGATGRYSNIKGFVKTGKNSATVSVTLRNRGPDAYKADDYGDAVIIERYFTSDGVSSYKLKSEGGRIVSTSKEELSNILSVMDIQIENPITVLTQEISRTFLVSKNSKAERLFQLFYQGTGLSKVHGDYNRAVQLKEDAKSELQKKKSVLPDMEKDIKTLKALLEKSSKVTELKKELCWAMVIEVEKEREEKAQVLEEIKRKVLQLKNKQNRFENELGTINQDVVVAEDEKKEAFQRMKDVRKDLDELKSKIDAKSSEIRQDQGTWSRHDREIKRINSQISNIENIIKEIKMNNESNVNEDKLRREVSLKNLRNQITNTEAAIGILETKKNSCRETVESTHKQIETCHAEIQEINYEKTKIMREKQQLIDGMKNRLNVFGPEMVHVLRDIKAGVQAGIFKQEPKGPIGLYINVKKPEWNFAVQECLRATFLKTFLCDNHADGEQLTKIFAKHFPRGRPSIITMKFVPQVYDVSSHKSLSKHPTLFDMLTIKDPVVANCLIDQKQIENILLIADPVEARNLMLYSPPERCSYAYTLNGDQFCHSPFRKYSYRNKNQIILLKTINDEDIRNKAEEIKSLDINQSSKITLKEKLLQQLKLNEEEIEMSSREITDMKLKINRLRMQLRDEENSFSEPKDINCLASDLSDLMLERATHEEQLEKYAEELKVKSEDESLLIQNMKEGRRILDEEIAKYSGFSAKVQELQSSKERIDHHIRKIQQQLELLKPEFEEKEKFLKDSEGTVKIFTDRALSACPRINTTRSSETLKQLFAETKKHVEKQRKGDRESLLKEYEEKVEKLNKAKTELIRQEKIIVRLDRMMAERFQEFQKICKNTSVSLTCAFTTLLKENNFSGYPDVNFDNHTLDIFAKPDKIKTKLGNKTNLAQLSGGERSYVTIAFLLSLWDRIHMPFRILDEYDVFMDSNNRHLSIHLLINSAKSNKKVQYIFLSPLELPPIDDSAHVKVHKMPAPRK